MFLSLHDLWILLIASLTAIACSILGVFLILRRMAMLGDAISHSVLLSLAVGFLLTGTRELYVMWPSAIAVGLLTAFLVQYLGRNSRVTEDAAIGIGFTSFFALGVILISSFAADVDLDQECVLYGEIALAPFDVLKLFGSPIGPRAFWNLFAILLLVIAFVGVGFRQLRCLCFDPLLSLALGLHVNRWHYSFMALVSILVVSSFESVGAILVIGMLVIPANFAYMLSRSLTAMLIVAPAYAVISCVLGYLIARSLDLSISAAIVSVMGLGFILLWFILQSLNYIEAYTRDQAPT